MSKIKNNPEYFFGYTINIIDEKNDTFSLHIVNGDGSRPNIFKGLSLYGVLLKKYKIKKEIAHLIENKLIEDGFLSEQNITKSIEQWHRKNQKEENVCIDGIIATHLENTLKFSSALDIDLDDVLFFADMHKHSRKSIYNMTHERRVAIIEAITEEIISAIGVANALGLDLWGALKEVNKDNWKQLDGFKKEENCQKPDLWGYV